MTRDEAIKIKLDYNDKLLEQKNLTHHDIAGNMIDAWAALGMLKLEEPKSARKKFKLAMMAKGFAQYPLGCALEAFDESQK